MSDDLHPTLPAPSEPAPDAPPKAKRRRRRGGKPQGADSAQRGAQGQASAEPHPAPSAPPPVRAPKPPKPSNPSQRPQTPQTPQALAAQALDALRALAFAVAAERGMTRADAQGLDHLIVPAEVVFDPSQREPGEPDPAAALLEEVSQQVAAAQRASMAFRAGHVYCFLCNLPDCEHAAPPHPESTFSGYTLSGRPEWVSFTNLCLARQHDRVDQLYSARPDVIAVTQSGAELTGNLLPPKGEQSRALSYRVRGQVSAGLVPRTFDLTDLTSPRLALTLQVVEIRYGKAPLRLRANLLGLSRRELSEAAASPAAVEAVERLGRLLKATDRRLRVVAYRANLLARRRKPDDEVEAQLQGILQGLRGELERTFRPQRRRTLHAQERHRSGERPTSDAMGDLLTARPEHVLRDAHEGTTIILGPRRRAHAFSAQGQHVTSLRLDPGELPRKVEQGRWRALPTAEAAACLAALIGQEAAGAGGGEAGEGAARSGGAGTGG